MLDAIHECAGCPFRHKLNHRARVRKAKLSQLQQFPDQHNFYLHLMAFIKHQVYCRYDYFVDIVLKSVQAAKNSAVYKLTCAEKHSRQERRRAVQCVAKLNRQKHDIIEQIKKITSASDASDTEKIAAIKHLLAQYDQPLSEQEDHYFQQCEELLNAFANNKALYDYLESGSIRLQNRVSGIIQSLVFNKSTSDPDLYQAIKSFVKKNHCDEKSPTQFLSPEEKLALFNENGKFRPSLYKTLLFIHIADAIKSGKLNIKYSYRYKAIQDYLISDERWQKDRIKLLEKAGLSEFATADTVMQDYKTKLSALYHHVNRRYETGLNPYLTIGDKNKIIIKTPAQDEKETEYVARLLSQHGLIPILQVLRDIDSSAHISTCFEHHINKNIRTQPKADTFFAGLIGLGCNIGISQMAIRCTHLYRANNHPSN